MSTLYVTALLLHDPLGPHLCSKPVSRTLNPNTSPPKGNIQVFLAYNYTLPTNLNDGVSEIKGGIMWSNRINLVGGCS